MTNIIERLLTPLHVRIGDANVGNEAFEIIGAMDIEAAEAAERIEELERQLAEALEANRKLHRRAQTAEGKLQRMEAAHEDACRIAFTKSIDYHLYASVLLNCNQGLFPKLVNKDDVVSDAAVVIRNQTLEEAAREVLRIASTTEVLERRVPVTDDFGEVVGHFIDSAGNRKRMITGERAAKAIRALSDSAPTPLQEQTANIGKEEG